jgi:hypothetical protein
MLFTPPLRSESHGGYVEPGRRSLLTQFPAAKPALSLFAGFLNTSNQPRFHPFLFYLIQAVKNHRCRVMHLSHYHKAASFLLCCFCRHR